jgi:hypothetical protein
VNVPADEVVVAFTTPVVELVTVIFAPTITEPVVSATVPLMPFWTWA